MKNALALLSALFDKKSTIQATVEEKEFRPFNLEQARNGAAFRLRSGKTFKIISLDHVVVGNPDLKVLIHVDDQPVPFCYYSDGFWNEYDDSGFDLVMVD